MTAVALGLGIIGGIISAVLAVMSLAKLVNRDD